MYKATFLASNWDSDEQFRFCFWTLNIFIKINRTPMLRSITPIFKYTAPYLKPKNDSKIEF